PSFFLPSAAMRLIRSAPGAGKTAFILREFKAALREGSAAPLRILVPTATLVRHLRHELARDGVIFAPSSVVSLNRFCTECAPDIRPVPAALLPAIVRDCLRHLRLPEFSTLLEADGLISTVIETIALFENAASTSDKLASVRG